MGESEEEPHKYHEDDFAAHLPWCNSTSLCQGLSPYYKAMEQTGDPSSPAGRKMPLKTWLYPRKKKKKKTVRLVSTIWRVCVLERKLETGTVHRSSRSENTTYGLKTFGAYRAPGMAVSGREDPTAACVERKGFWPQQALIDMLYSLTAIFVFFKVKQNKTENKTMGQGNCFQQCRKAVTYKDESSIHQWEKCKKLICYLIETQWKSRWWPSKSSVHSLSLNCTKEGSQPDQQWPWYTL